MKRCSLCKNQKDAIDFYSHIRMKDGLSHWCKACTKDKYQENAERNREYARNYMKAHKKERASYMVKYRTENPEKAKRQRREQDLRISYGITVRDYDKMYESQNGKCKICGKEKNLLHIDHNHQNQKIRGLLCNSCNRALGFFYDNVSSLRKAVEYLEGTA